MNNLTFGNDQFSHYETIGGGSGAAIGQDGESAVQVHMTNTAITDPEDRKPAFPSDCLLFVNGWAQAVLVVGRAGRGSSGNICLRKPLLFPYSPNAGPAARAVYQAVCPAYLVSSFLFAKVEKKWSSNPSILSRLIQVIG